MASSTTSLKCGGRASLFESMTARAAPRSRTLDLRIESSLRGPSLCLLWLSLGLMSTTRCRELVRHSETAEGEVGEGEREGPSTSVALGMERQNMLHVLSPARVQRADKMPRATA